MNNAHMRDPYNYQIGVESVAIFPRECTDPKKIAALYLSTGLSGESGEICELIKKWFRGDGDLDLDKMKKELGDTLWYVTQLCNEFDIDLRDVMESNMTKLLDRQARGVLMGSGDDR